MKAKVIVLLISAVLYSFTNLDTEKLRVKQTKNLLTGNITDYFYNTDGKISRNQNSKGITTSYQYSGNMIIKTTTGVPNDKDVTDTFFLNRKQRAEIITSTTGSKQRLEFDAKGHFIKNVMEYSNNQPGLRSVWEWEGDNLKSNTSYDEEGQILSRIVYSYHKDKLNTTSQKFMGMEFMGQDSKNLLKESFTTGLAVAKGDTTRTFYNYQFNEQGAVKVKAVYDKRGTLTDSIAYTYY